ncbi:MAG TPA: biotin/lipoyl-containing protein [Candidatus Krumholzibacterium sp.]|nr:biotin/lipoyl-containing protein [Candidatus Krumholzibacterium sp.]
MAKKKIRFMNTAFRDGFQSVFGARVFTDDFIPAVEACAEAGIRYYEAGGGARFQSLYFYSDEDAFEMMDRFREAAGPEADLQTLARGINVVALDSQPRDIIKLHADLFARHGITSIRNFDALNDIDNLRYSGKCIAEAGLNHQAAITMMALPPGCEGAHDPAFYETILRRVLGSGIPYSSISFKDASGTSTPATVYETIRRARAILPPETILNFHTHDTAGTAIVCYKAALEAGADTIDLSMAPCSGGTCQPDIATMWHALRGTDFDLDVDIEKVMKAEAVFKDCMKDYFVPPESKAVEPLIPWSPMPGGALTANTQMMRDNDIMDRFPEVIAALGEVVKRGGFGTSVTPVSQFYFQQAFNNVMMGSWKKIAEGYGKMVLGYFGKTPIEPDPEIVAVASKQLGLEPLAGNPLDVIEKDPEKGIEAAKKRLAHNGIEVTDENIFIVSACGEKGIQYLLGNATLGVRKKSGWSGEGHPSRGSAAGGAGNGTATPAVRGDERSPSAPSTPPPGPSDTGGSFTVTINDHKYAVVLEGGKVTVNGKDYDVEVAEGIDAATLEASARLRQKHTVTAPMVGTIVRILVQKGDIVSKGDPLLVQEAMKMEMAVTAPVGGHIADIPVQVGQHVKADQVLLYIS